MKSRKSIPYFPEYYSDMPADKFNKAFVMTIIIIRKWGHIKTLKRNNVMFGMFTIALYSLIKVNGTRTDRESMVPH